MKDTIGWIDYIPDGWNIMKFRQLITRISTGLNPRDNFKLTKDDNLYYVTIRNFKDGKLYLDDKCDRISYESWKIIQERSDLHKGDILFASISKDGQAYLLKEEPASWNVNESVFCIRVNKKYMDARYFTYEITSTRYYDDLRMDATGTTFKSIKQNNLKQSRLLVPPISEQQAIADYLDEKCSKIDEIIAEAKASIDEYKKLRIAAVNDAVTHGIHNNAIKDSNVDWIGKIPDNWKIIITKRLFKIKKDIAGKEGYTVLSITQKGIVPKVFGGKGQFAADYSNYQLVNKGDFAMNHMDLLTGWLDISEYDGVTSPDYRVFVPTGYEDIYAPYYKYVMQNCYSCRIYYGLGHGVAGMGRWRLPADMFLNFKLPMPPKAEQKEIVEFLDKRTKEIDSLIAEKESLINDLEAYKKSLIYEVVTGKRRVV